MSEDMVTRVASTMAGTYSVSVLKPEGRELWLVLARAAIEAMQVYLQDPIVVHANMLRGTIAKPSPAQIMHLYPGQFALAPPEPQDGETT